MIKNIYSFFISRMGFKVMGRGSVIKFPNRIWNKDCISVGNDVFIVENSFIAVSKRYGKQRFKPVVSIGNNVRIGGNFILGCINKVTLEDDVLIADRVFISDHVHEYEDIKKPITSQKLSSKGPITIRKGAFIGVNAVILAGVTIGRNSVIGASSVVTKSVPDFTVVAGSPARVIKKYDFKKEKWIQVGKLKT